MSLTSVTITGTYQPLPGLAVAIGKVTFELEAPITGTAGNVLVPRVQLSANLVGGAIPAGFTLYATDDTGSQPANNSYRVTEQIVGAPTRTYNIAASKTQPGLTLDLSSVAPTLSSPQYAYLSATDASVTNARRPLPLGARFVPIGDSITAGTGSTLSDTAANNGDSRKAVGGWPSRLAGQHPDRYYYVRNAGVGGDIIGGIGTLTTAVAAGANTITVQLAYGCRPYNANASIYVGGYTGSPHDTMTLSAVTVNGGGSYTLTFTGTLANSYAAGAEIGWGMHGRLQYHVLGWSPEMSPIMAGTNDSGSTAVTGTTALSAAEVVAGSMDLGARMRAVSCEPVFLEVLPRSTNQAKVAQINDELRYQCRARGYHLVPLYQLFAGSDGAWAVGANTSDGLHPTDLGHQRVADAVHQYLTSVPLRLGRVPLAAYDTDPNNLISNACFLTASGGVPAGWTGVPFFSTNTTPSIVAPAAGDGIIGNWARLTCTTGAAGNYALRQTIATQAVGSLMYFAMRIRVSGAAAGFQATVNFLTGSFTLDLGYLLSQNCDFTIMGTTTALAANSLSTVNVQVIPNGAAGVLDVAQPILQNLTTLGRAA